VALTLQGGEEVCGSHLGHLRRVLRGGARNVGKENHILEAKERIVLPHRLPLEDIERAPAIQPSLRPSPAPPHPPRVPVRH